MSIVKLQMWKLAPFFKSKPEAPTHCPSVVAVCFPVISQAAIEFRNLLKAVVVLYKKMYIEILRILLQLLAI